MGLKGQIGIVHDSSNVEIAPGTKEPGKVRLLGDLFYNRLILDTSIKGELPGELIPLLRENGIENDYIKLDDALIFAKGKVDYIGMNVYNRMYLTDWSEGETEVFHNNRGAGSKAKEGMRIKGWYETAIAPDTQAQPLGPRDLPQVHVQHPDGDPGALR